MGSSGRGDFPLFSGFPNREIMWAGIIEFLGRYRSGGSVVSQISAARLLGISPQHVRKLIEEGRLEAISFDGQRFVTSDSLCERASQERKIRKARTQR